MSFAVVNLTVSGNVDKKLLLNCAVECLLSMQLEIPLVLEHGLCRTKGLRLDSYPDSYVKTTLLKVLPLIKEHVIDTLKVRDPFTLELEVLVPVQDDSDEDSDDDLKVTPDISEKFKKTFCGPPENPDNYELIWLGFQANYQGDNEYAGKSKYITIPVWYYTGGQDQVAYEDTYGYSLLIDDWLMHNGFANYYCKDNCEPESQITEGYKREGKRALRLDSRSVRLHNNKILG